MVWGIATAHEYYHPNPLRGKKIDRYYGEFVKVGHALGGTDLPATKADTLDCLQSYLPRLALTYGAAMSTGPNLARADPGPPGGEFIDWAIRDVLPGWAAAMVMHRRPNPIERAMRQASVWAVINGIHFTMGPLPEFRQAQSRVAAPTGAPACRRRRRRTRREPTPNVAARRPSRWPDPPMGWVAVGNEPFTRSRLTGADSGQQC